MPKQEEANGRELVGRDPTPCPHAPLLSLQVTLLGGAVALTACIASPMRYEASTLLASVKEGDFQPCVSAVRTRLQAEPQMTQALGYCMAAVVAISLLLGASVGAGSSAAAGSSQQPDAAKPASPPAVAEPQKQQLAQQPPAKQPAAPPAPLRTAAAPAPAPAPMSRELKPWEISVTTLNNSSSAPEQAQQQMAAKVAAPARPAPVAAVAAAAGPKGSGEAVWFGETTLKTAALEAQAKAAIGDFRSPPPTSSSSINGSAATKQQQQQLGGPRKDVKPGDPIIWAAAVAWAMVESTSSSKSG
jgi:hypothetical protein